MEVHKQLPPNAAVPVTQALQSFSEDMRKATKGCEAGCSVCKMCARMMCSLFSLEAVLQGGLVQEVVQVSAGPLLREGRPRGPLRGSPGKALGPSHPREAAGGIPMPGRAREARPHGHAHRAWHAWPWHSCKYPMRVSPFLHGCPSVQGQACGPTQGSLQWLVKQRHVRPGCNMGAQAMLAWSWREARASWGSTCKAGGPAMGSPRTHARRGPASLEGRPWQRHVAACMASTKRRHFCFPSRQTSLNLGMRTCSQASSDIGRGVAGPARMVSHLNRVPKQGCKL